MNSLNEQITEYLTYCECRKDTVTTKYMRQSQIFADAFNYYIYGGEQVIDPDGLEELDTREGDVPLVPIGSLVIA